MALLGKIFSTVIGSNANKSALRAQQDAATKSLDAQERMYNLSREDLAPFRETGTTAQNTLAYLLGLAPTSKTKDGITSDNYANIDKNIGGYGSLSKRFSMNDFQADPGYNFVLSEGEKALNRKRRAGGNFLSGAATKEAIDYGQNMASTEYGKVRNRYNEDMNTLYNRIAGITNTGMGAVNTGVNQNALNSSVLGNIYGNLGNAKANYRVAQGNLWGDFASDPLEMNKNASSYAGLAQFFSDMRLKENIILQGEENGHKIYKFNYIGNPQKFIGVIAQDVQKINPDAVSQDGGYLKVDYNKIGVNFREA